jgi:hypothetical protein
MSTTQLSEKKSLTGLVLLMMIIAMAVLLRDFALPMFLG